MNKYKIIIIMGNLIIKSIRDYLNYVIEKKKRIQLQYGLQYNKKRLRKRLKT